jgi:hypothetical protein
MPAIRSKTPTKAIALIVLLFFVGVFGFDILWDRLVLLRV